MSSHPKLARSNAWRPSVEGFELTNSGEMRCFASPLYYSSGKKKAAPWVALELWLQVKDEAPGPKKNWKTWESRAQSKPGVMEGRLLKQWMGQGVLGSMRECVLHLSHGTDGKPQLKLEDVECDEATGRYKAAEYRLRSMRRFEGNADKSDRGRWATITTLMRRARDEHVVHANADGSVSGMSSRIAGVEAPNLLWRADAGGTRAEAGRHLNLMFEFRVKTANSKKKKGASREGFVIIILRPKKRETDCGVDAVHTLCVRRLESLYDRIRSHRSSGAKQAVMDALLHLNATGNGTNETTSRRGMSRARRLLTTSANDDDDAPSARLEGEALHLRLKGAMHTVLAASKQRRKGGLDSSKLRPSSTKEGRATAELDNVATVLADGGGGGEASPLQAQSRPSSDSGATVPQSRAASIYSPLGSFRAPPRTNARPTRPTGRSAAPRGGRGGSVGLIRAGAAHILRIAIVGDEKTGKTSLASSFVTHSPIAARAAVHTKSESAAADIETGGAADGLSFADTPERLVERCALPSLASPVPMRAVTFSGSMQGSYACGDGAVHTLRFPIQTRDYIDCIRELTPELRARALDITPADTVREIVNRGAFAKIAAAYRRTTIAPAVQKLPKVHWSRPLIGRLDVALKAAESDYDPLAYVVMLDHARTTTLERAKVWCADVEKIVLDARPHRPWTPIVFFVNFVDEVDQPIWDTASPREEYGRSPNGPSLPFGTAPPLVAELETFLRERCARYDLVQSSVRIVVGSVRQRRACIYTLNDYPPSLARAIPLPLSEILHWLTVRIFAGTVRVDDIKCTKWLGGSNEGRFVDFEMGEARGRRWGISVSSSDSESDPDDDDDGADAFDELAVAASPAHRHTQRGVGNNVSGELRAGDRVAVEDAQGRAVVGEVLLVDEAAATFDVKIEGTSTVRRGLVLLPQRRESVLQGAVAVSATAAAGDADKHRGWAAAGCDRACTPAALCAQQ